MCTDRSDQFNASHRQDDNVAAPLSQRAYESSPAGRVARTQYLQSPKGRQARRDQQARWNTKRREMLNQIKLERGCVDCGYDSHPAALQFDHVRGHKDFTIGSQGVHFALDRLMDEIAKCDVRCANCHAVKTHGPKG